jgi:hypothetical protein
MRDSLGCGPFMKQPTEIDQRLSPVPAADIPPVGTRTRAIVVELAIGSLLQAFVRVWGQFTVLGFVDYLAQGLVASAILLPVILSIKQMVSDARERSGRHN